MPMSLMQSSTSAKLESNKNRILANQTEKTSPLKQKINAEIMKQLATDKI